VINDLVKTDSSDYQLDNVNSISS